MPMGLLAYRGAAALTGWCAPLLRGFGARGSAWRSAWSGATSDLAAASGSVWVHAASMGEVVAARTWIQALLDSGHRAPILLTTRTSRGLARARRELTDRVVGRIAPLDLPQLLRSFLESAAPWRLAAPHSGIPEAKRGRGLPERDRLRADARTAPPLGPRGPGRLRRGRVGARAIGAERGTVPIARRALLAHRGDGDLKAEPPVETASRDPAARPGVVFGSLRPGEEDLALALARRVGFDGGRALVVAPRHEEGLARVLGALERAGIPRVVRRETDRGTEALGDWIAGLVAGTPRVGILATQGELPLAYESAAVAIVGGTFAPYGGHNALEPAARGAAIVVGPHAEGIQESVDSLAREGALLSAPGVEAAAESVGSLLRDPEALRRMGQGAVRAASAASESARRSLEAIERFGLNP